MAKFKRFAVPALLAVVVLLGATFCFVVGRDRAQANALCMELTRLNVERDQIREVISKRALAMHIEKGRLSLLPDAPAKGRELLDIEKAWIGAMAEEVVICWRIKDTQEEILRLERRPWVSTPPHYWGSI